MTTSEAPLPEPPLTVVQVGYPFAPVGPDAVGGAEQVLSALAAGLVARGHRSLVVAPDGSRPAGELICLPPLPPATSATSWERAAYHVRRVLATIAARIQVDVYHLHAYGFERFLPPAGRPVLVTLHLPISWYGPQALCPARPVAFNCVSLSQHATLPGGMAARVVSNGVDLDLFSSGTRKRGYVLALGRICPEKGLHLAIEAAARAGTPLILAGQLFPYPAHVRYFEQEIKPRLGRGCRYIGPAGLARKRRLLAGAQCLLVPSLAAETSSLVTLEALASGTPVVAFRTGALPELIEHGRTGFLVDSAVEMAEVIPSTAALDALDCRIAARRRDLCHTIDSYLALYRELANGVDNQRPGTAGQCPTVSV